MEEVVKRHTLESFREKHAWFWYRVLVLGTSVRGEGKTLIEPPSS